MNERFRELVLAGVAIGVVLVGALVEAVADPVVRPEATVAEEGLYLERSVFCPPLPDAKDAAIEGTVHHVVGPVADESVLIGASTANTEPRPVDGKVLQRDVTEPVATDFTGFGGWIDAASSVTYRSPLAGLAATGCSRSASAHWYFPYGSSAQGFNEWIVLYNPFPDEAVMRATLLSETHQQSKSLLSDIAVSAGRVTSIRLNDVVRQQRGVGVQIDSVRGRVIAWQTVFAQPEERPPGVGMTLGAARTGTDWYFPAGAVGEGIDEHISIMNPSNSQAIVTVSVVTEDAEALQPPDLVETAIPRRSSREISLAQAIDIKDLGGVSVSVRSVNEVPIVVQRTIWYGQGEFRGFTTELGASVPATAWWVGPGAAKADADSLILLNASDEEASVGVILLTLDGEPITGGELAGLTIGPQARLKVPLQQLTGGRAAAAIVTSSVPIVAERIFYSSSAADVSTTMGSPLVF